MYSLFRIAVYGNIISYHVNRNELISVLGGLSGTMVGSWWFERQCSQANLSTFATDTLCPHPFWYSFIVFSQSTISIMVVDKIKQVPYGVEHTKGSKTETNRRESWEITEII